MWPGSDLPVGPPPPPTPRSYQELPRIRPGGGWYLLPAVLVMISVIVVVWGFALNWDEFQAADGPRASGDARAGIEVETTSGHNYFVHIRPGDPAPTACALAYAGQSASPVPLTKVNSWSVTPPTGYRYTATFTAPLSGTAKLSCQGVGDEVLIVPDDTAYGFVGLAVIASMLIGLAGCVGFAVILIMRMSSAKRRRAAMNPYKNY